MMNSGGPQHKTQTEAYRENPDSPVFLSTHYVIYNMLYFILLNNIPFNEEGY